MVDQVTPVLGIDEFQSRIGEDSDIMVLNFIVSGQDVGGDLVDWLERGYDCIIDAEVSPGEVLDKKYYVFAEMNRRSSSAKRIMEMLDDLNTLTDIKADEWEFSIDGKRMPATVEAIQAHVALTPSEYKKGHEGELNEWREIAGLPTVKIHEDNPDLMDWKRTAGII